MDEKRKGAELYKRNREVRILSDVVDAMLDVAADLQKATADEWTRILVDSCRRLKKAPPAAAAGSRVRGSGGSSFSIAVA